ncbi:diguanylate cyclase [Spirulina sp. CCNP1310]|uniref:diguanylate cyclase domain-containing protein n=1 Tax=Spirulina sp. CCNP1310 TaxID=3110249 RepID=UPI002B1F6F33|nr:diguanylate cyclase [Spirulina sp. CCNP1310]MEA5418963.1 diguanylate cyclase [Spirulina sp. CCNP1310]
MSQTTEPSKGDILIIDDTPNNVRLLSTLLTNHGYEVRGVINGEIGLRAARSAVPDLILLDISMPKLSGYDVCEALKADPLTQAVPVIFISAFNEVGDKVKAFEVGGVDYITKPFQWAEVLARVQNQLKICLLQKQLQARNTQLHLEIQERAKAEVALHAANEKLQALANQDGLTGTSNRRHFDDYLLRCWQTGQGMIALILCDVDFFKPFNDHYGHLEGDRCLQILVQAIQSALDLLAPHHSLLARYGGEEFAIVLPETDIHQAQGIAQGIQAHVAQAGIPHAYSTIHCTVTVSLGIAALHPTADFSPDDLISQADQALYMAKSQGRNQVICYGQGSANRYGGS